MDQEIFNFFNKQIKKDFGKTASKETLLSLLVTAPKESKKMELSQFFNWINLYAFGTGMTTAEADRLRIERYKQENAL